MTIHWKAVEEYVTVAPLFFNITHFVILENLSVSELALSGVKGLNGWNHPTPPIIEYK